MRGGSRTHRQRRTRLQLELLATHQLAGLERREADVALRGTASAPGHQVGVRLGVVRSALWAHRSYLGSLPPGTPIDATAWAVPDADPNLANYPLRRWRRARWPSVVPRLRCDGMLAVTRAVQYGAAIGVAPHFLMAGLPDLVDLSGPLPEIDTEIRLLTHPDMRHLRRVRAFFDFVRTDLVLPSTGDRGAGGAARRRRVTAARRRSCSAARRA